MNPSDSVDWFDRAKMMEFFESRTNKHIKAVKKFCKKIFEYDKERFDGIMESVAEHDASKFEDPELDPYLFVTWKYKCKDEGKEFEVPKDIEDAMNDATEHHIVSNGHHPECHCGKKKNLINKDDRDAVPKEAIDATKMPDLDIAEMVADWCAVSEERGNSPKGWADKNVGTRWKFNDEQKDLIYELIKAVWK